jgi:hypothetical protein
MLNRTRIRPVVNREKPGSRIRGTARSVRLPFVRRIIRASDSCDHRWIFLAPGYQMCAKCRAVRKKPSFTGEHHT